MTHSCVLHEFRVDGHCYNHGCRCVGCRESHRERFYYWRKHRQAGRLLPKALVDGTGARRRLQALLALGWTHQQLSARAGVSDQAVHLWRTRTGPMQKQTVERIARLYAEMEYMRPPEPVTVRERKARTTVLNLAVKYGWVPPAAWDDIDADPFPPGQEPADWVDESAVELAVMGQKPTLTRREREAAVERLYGRKWSDPRMARYLGCSGSAVMNARRDAGLPAWEHHDMEWDEAA